MTERNISEVKQNLASINAEIADINQSKFRGGATELQRRLNTAYTEAVQCREFIDETNPSLWDDPETPAPPAIPDAPHRWFMAALKSVQRRNSRRAFIKCRLSVIRDIWKQEAAEGREQDIAAERHQLIAEAQQLGPIEHYDRSPAARTMLKIMAWHLHDLDEMQQAQREECIECGNLAREGRTHCHDCDAFEDERFISDDTGEAVLVSYDESLAYEFSY